MNFKNDCIKLDSKNSFFYILGYSIYKEDKLEILLKKYIL